MLEGYKRAPHIKLCICTELPELKLDRMKAKRWEISWFGYLHQSHYSRYETSCQNRLALMQAGALGPAWLLHMKTVRNELLVLIKIYRINIFIWTQTYDGPCTHWGSWCSSFCGSVVYLDFLCQKRKSWFLVQMDFLLSWPDDDEHRGWHVCVQS